MRSSYNKQSLDVNFCTTKYHYRIIVVNFVVFDTLLAVFFRIRIAPHEGCEAKSCHRRYYPFSTELMEFTTTSNIAIRPRILGKDVSFK